MELYSPEVRREVNKMLDAKKLCLISLHLKSRDPLCDMLRNHSEARLYEVTLESRDSLVNELASGILGHLEGVGTS
jgi:nucleoside-triphosphatase THEP1